LKKNYFKLRINIKYTNIYIAMNKYRITFKITANNKLDFEQLTEYIILAKQGSLTLKYIFFSTN